MSCVLSSFVTHYCHLQASSLGMKPWRREWKSLGTSKLSLQAASKARCEEETVQKADVGEAQLALAFPRVYWANRFRHAPQEPDLI